jgi:hypothetical protein
LIKNPLETIKISRKEKKVAGGFNCCLNKSKSLLCYEMQEMETDLELGGSFGVEVSCDGFKLSSLQKIMVCMI